MLRPELARDDNFVDRFYTEAKSLATLNHSNITTLYSLHSEGPDAYMVMELVNGQTLEALLAKVGHLTLRDSLAIMAQAIPGLRYAHRRGVVHRDLKPANLMVTDDGLVKIMDFGIARMQGTQHLTRVGEFCGTFVYASPEQIRGEEVDERSDLYSLAIVFYRMLVGEAPFAATNEYALMTAHLQTPPPSLAGRVPDLDADTEAVLMRALAKKPEDRFNSVEEFGKAVGAAALRGESVEILAQLYAHAFGDAGDIEATRVVTGGRSRPPVSEPTPPSNRRTWQLPAMSANETMVLSRPSVAPPASNPMARRPGTPPAPVTPAAADALRLTVTPVPAADGRRRVRPLLMGVSAVAVTLLLGGGYYLASDWHGTEALHEVSNMPVPKPMTSEPAPAEPAVTHDAPPTPAVTEPVAPAPVKTAEVEAPPIAPPTPPPVGSPKPVPIVVPAPMDAAPALPPMAQLPPLPAPAPPAPPVPVILPVPPPPSPPVAPVTPVAPVATIDPVSPPVSKTGLVISPPPEPPVASAPATPPPIPDLPPSHAAASGGDVKVAALEPKASDPPPPLGPQPPAQPQKPEGEPDLLGKVTGAKGLDELELGGRWIKLYGIVDNSRGNQEASHVQALLGYLRPAHGIVVCYRKPGGTHRCYADGHDIATLALRDRLVRPAANAPAEYRSSLVQKQ
jgi:serine/threonine-protein kinase